jgi:hypothetical protein
VKTFEHLIGLENEYFIDLYMSALQGFYSNPYLKPPKIGSERYNNLIRAREIVDKIEGEYSDFISFQFIVYKHFRIAPKPENLITEKSIRRYVAHQKLKNLYNTKEYFIHGDSFTVKKTRITYPFSQVLVNVSQDSVANYAYSIPKMEINEELSEAQKDRIRISLAYLEAKLKYQRITIPDSIKELIEKTNP